MLAPQTQGSTESDELLSFILSHVEQFRRARLPSLYSDFTLQRHSNPDGYAANVAAWMDALRKAARVGLLPIAGEGHNTLSFGTGEGLLKVLETGEWGRPLALEAVIDEAISQRQMIPYKEFLTAQRSIYSRKWIVQPWWLLSWGLKRLGIANSTSPAGIMSAGRFVIVSNVEEAAAKIMARMANQGNQIDRIYPMSNFRREAAMAMDISAGISQQDLDIILTHLARDRGCIVYNRETVKFKSLADSSPTLTSQDNTIASLKALITDLELHIASLASRVADLSAKAHKAIENKNRVSALAVLRQKKYSESTLARRTETLSQLEQVFHKIEQAADQVAIINIMESSKTVLETLHTEIGGIERVEGVVDDLKEEMLKVDEIGNVMEAGGPDESTIDESAVDEELENLLQQANATEKMEEAGRTQQRLAEIEAVEASTADTEMTPRTLNPASRRTAKTEDDKIDEGINSLKRLSLNKDPPLPEIHEDKRTVSVPELASAGPVR